MNRKERRKHKGELPPELRKTITSNARQLGKTTYIPSVREMKQAIREAWNREKP